MAGTSTYPPTATESVYVVRGGVPPEAITRSLQTLLATRRHSIVRREFTELDTFDGRIKRARARLTRTGKNGTCTVTWHPAGGGHLSVRLKQPVNFVWDLPDGKLQQELEPVIGVRRLLARINAEAYGSQLEVLDDLGKTVARMRIESGRARLPTGRGPWHTLPTLITLSGLRGYEDAYQQLVPLIESRPDTECCPDGLQGVILRQLGAPDRDDVSSLRLNLAPTVRADGGARQIHQGLLGVLKVNEPGVRENLDTEFLHDFRVALRRTRSLLSQIRHVFPSDAIEHFSGEFSWIGRRTGPLRDMDVLVLALREQRDVPAEEMEALNAFLGRAQQREHHALVEALDSRRYRRLLSDWEAFLERPARSDWLARNAGRLLAQVVSQRAWRLSRRITASAKTIDEHTAPARLHEVRIDAKKLRYLVDVTPTFYDAADLHLILAALKKLQRVLGDFNDAQVQEKRLVEYGQALGADGGPSNGVLVIGRLAEQRRQRCETLRGQIVDALEQFSDRDAQSSCRRAFKRTAAAERAR